MRGKLAVTGLLIMAAAGAANAQPTFQGLGYLGGFGGVFFDGRATAVSADGRTVVGESSTDAGYEAFKWTAAGGMVGLGFPAGQSTPESHATAISAGGGVIVGNAPADDGWGFRWTQDTGFVGLGDLPGGSNFSQAYGVSASGNVIVGSGDEDFGAEASRWTAETGIVGLGFLPGGSSSSAADCSAGGDVIVGNSGNGTDMFAHAFRWTASTGMVDLGALVPGGWSNAAATNADGSVVVGGAGLDLNSGGPYTAFRWTAAAGMEPLGELSGGAQISTFAFAMSANSGVIVGQGFDETVFTYQAIIWDSAHGLRNLQDVLTIDFGLGTELENWTLTSASGVSADGRTIVGEGINPDGFSEGWVATIGQRCGSTDFNGDGDIGTDADIDAFFACLGGSCCPACGSVDFNGDGDIGTDADIDAFFRVLAGGTC